MPSDLRGSRWRRRSAAAQYYDLAEFSTWLDR
jgi:hypothetical protein